MVSAETPKKSIPRYDHSVYHGIVYPPHIKSEIVDDLRARSKLRGGSDGADIVIATYPKCGTTWAQQIVLTLLAGGNKDVVRDPMKMSPWPEVVASAEKKEAETCGNGVDDFIGWNPPLHTQVKQPGRRVIKTHAPVHLVPWQGGIEGVPVGARVIVVARDPRDVAVSFHHHACDIPHYNCTASWEDFLSELFIPGNVESGSYWEWYAGWWAAQEKDQSKILWLTYEELHADLDAAVRKVAGFCDISADDDVVANVVKAGSFQSMKKQFAEEDAKKAARGEYFKKNHIRCGKTKAWKTNFSEPQEAMLMAHHSQKCQELGIPHDLLLA